MCCWRQYKSTYSGSYVLFILLFILIGLPNMCSSRIQGSFEADGTRGAPFGVDFSVHVLGVDEKPRTSVRAEH